MHAEATERRSIPGDTTTGFSADSDSSVKVGPAETAWQESRLFKRELPVYWAGVQIFRTSMVFHGIFQGNVYSAVWNGIKEPLINTRSINQRFPAISHNSL